MKKRSRRIHPEIFPLVCEASWCTEATAENDYFCVTHAMVKAKIHRFEKKHGKTNKRYIKRVNNICRRDEVSPSATVSAMPAFYKGSPGSAESDGTGIREYQTQKLIKTARERKQARHEANRPMIQAQLDKGQVPIKALSIYWTEKLMELVADGTITMEQVTEAL